MTQDYWIPRTLDAPPLMLMFEADVAVIFLFIVFLFMTMEAFLMGVFLAVVAARSYSKLKEEGGKGLLIKILYWYTPADYWFSEQRPSHIREYIGA